MSVAVDRTNQNFVYPSLNHQTQEIRLLRVVKVTKKLIECELRNFGLKDAHIKWTALSYCWGSGAATDTIRVNDTSFMIRPNLHKFLAELKTKTSSVPEAVDWLFIDAICIDQSNLAERASQVVLMRQVYQKADLVIAWIPFEGTSAKTKRSKEDCMFSALIDPYWTRLWIVQELVIAQRLLIVTGESSFTWKDILQYIERSDEDGIFGTYTTAILDQTALSAFMADAIGPGYGGGKFLPFIAAARILRYRRGQQANVPGKQVSAFFEAVNHFSTQHCTVMHDKVYALLGMAQCYIVPDYTSPLIGLFAQLLTNYLVSLGFEKDSSAESMANQLTAADPNLHGQMVFRSLDLDPRNLAVFVVTRAVSSFFAPQEGRTLHAVLIAWWIRVFLDNPDREIQPPAVRRKWLESQKKIDRQTIGDMVAKSFAYVDEIDQQLQVMREDDITLVTPAGGPAYQISELEVTTKSCCEEVWTRYSEAKELKDLAYSCFQEVLGEHLKDPEMRKRWQQRLDDEAKRKQELEDWTGADATQTKSITMLGKIIKSAQSWFQK